MQKRAPSLPQIAVMVVFALSCSLIIIYIWKSFGGPSPLAPEGYRLTANFQEATQLADSADVRISGVTVGRVVKTVETSGRTRVTMQIDRRYAPIPRDTRAILRQKTLLGETYVELSPGDRRSGLLPDNGALANRQVASTTELDEVTRVLDARTRRDVRRLLGALAAALRDTAVLAPQRQATCRDVDRLVTASRRGVPAATRIVHGTKPVFDVLVPVLRNAQPLVDYLGLYKGELVSQLSSVAAAFQASEPQVAGGPSFHYLRALVPFSSEAAVAQAKRLGSNRHNPYPLPGH